MLLTLHSSRVSSSRGPSRARGAMASQYPQNTARSKGFQQQQSLDGDLSYLNQLYSSKVLQSNLLSQPLFRCLCIRAVLLSVELGKAWCLSQHCGGFKVFPRDTSLSRGSLQPSLALSYHSRAGNGHFGLGRSLSEPDIPGSQTKGCLFPLI